jgi:hypothetical protein
MLLEEDRLGEQVKLQNNIKTDLRKEVAERETKLKWMRNEYKGELFLR